ncbi:MAG: hypothetical protein Q8P86_00885 [bacterium]|nr:hypothetical protein [bacterium]
MDTNQIYSIETELNLMEDEIMRLQIMEDVVGEGAEEMYELRVNELEDKMENLRETFNLLRAADEETWNDVKDIFYNGLDEVKLTILGLKKQTERISTAVAYDAF